MNRIRRVAVLAISAMACVVLGSASNAGAQAPAGQDTGGKQPYTMPEYNAEGAHQWQSRTGYSASGN